MIKKINNNLMIVAILFFAFNQFSIGQAIGSSSIAFNSSSGFNGSKIQLDDNAAENEIILAILPQDKDTIRPYKWQGKDVTLSARVPDNGYDMLVAMNKINLTTTEQKDRFKNLTDAIYHPCCNAPVGGCGCKHAIAAQGVIKYLLTQEYSDSQIRDEVFLWNRYWWPKHYATVAVYLSSQGTNPAKVSTEDWLGKELSTIRAGRQMKAALGI